VLGNPGNGGLDGPLAVVLALPLLAHQARRPEQPVDLGWVAAAPEGQMEAESLVRARIVALVGRDVALEQGLNRPAIAGAKHALEQVVVVEAATRRRPVCTRQRLRRLLGKELRMQPLEFGRHHMTSWGTPSRMAPVTVKKRSTVYISMRPMPG
jgi:hypothetical protein